MKLTLIFLIAALLFICWSLYNISEGFQTAGNETPEQAKCSVLKSAYKDLENRHENAIKNNNSNVLATTKQSIDALKTALNDMGC